MKFKKVLYIIAIFTLVLFISACGKKEVTITFDSNGGNSIEDITIKRNEKVNKPNDPVREGYKFIYWEYMNEEYNFNDEVETNIKLVAKWEEEDLSNAIKYTVKFDSNGGSAVVDQIVVEKKFATKPTDPTKTGIVFSHWELDGKEYDFNTRVEKDITLKAKWVTEDSVTRYTVKFNADGGSKVNDVLVVENKTLTAPKNPTKTGYIFEGWTLDNKDFSFTTKITKDITLTAKWRKEKTFTITFDSNGGSAVAKQTVSETKTVTKPKEPTKAGQVFVSWQLDGKNYTFGSKPTKDITLKAVWAKAVSITFDSDGGTEVATIKTAENTTANQPANPTKNGYNFKGWQLDGAAFSFSSKIVQDITLKATWELKKYTVSFNSGTGGSSVTSQIIEHGGQATKPADPTRSGYTFMDWTLNNNPYDFNTNVTSNITLVAKWQQVQSNITYSISWVKIESSSIGQYTLYIRSSEGNNVSGKVRLTTTAGTTSVVDIPSTGKTYIKSAIESASVESVN